MLEHFESNVVRPKKLKGKAKAMVVTRNIESAIQVLLGPERGSAGLPGGPYKPRGGLHRQEDDRWGGAHGGHAERLPRGRHPQEVQKG